MFGVSGLILLSVETKSSSILSYRLAAGRLQLSSITAGISVKMFVPTRAYTLLDMPPRLALSIAITTEYA